ncbi:MAG: flippase-like domain-containing protein [Bacillati bacterium ANGP1]|uniref:Flippase-like domain-containing protein n=1 Tax=Candidatus Segetimicrobium genomatis TaxID=2569760 RepID=A0A537KP98_9BACT|nr:MAG: flippase-like domain-containing protein [Terrabacteria group bacterium ANGP1]
MTRWVRAALLVLGFVILAGFVRSVDLAAIVLAVTGADAGRLALAVLLLIANVTVKAARWRIMAGMMSQRPLSLPAAETAILAGVAAASLTPGRGLELAKPLLLRASHGVPMASSTAAVVVERLLDGAALIVLFAVSLVAVPAGRGSAFYPVIAAIALFLTAGAALLLLPHRLTSIAMWVTDRLPLPAPMRFRVASVAERFAGGLAVWRQSGKLGLLLAASVAAAFLEILRLTAVFAALGLRVGLVDAMLAFCAANLLGAATFIPGGIGITELSLAGIITLVTAIGPAATVAAAVLLDRALSYYLIVALGALILVVASRRTPVSVHDRR